jgi:hypothetical protein
MARDIKVTDTGDIDLSTGDLQFVEDENELVQVCETKLLKIKGEDAYAQDSGVDMFGVMFNQAVSDDFRKVEVRSQFAAIPEVKGTPSVEIEQEGHTVSMNLTIDSVYGPLTDVGI